MWEPLSSEEIWKDGQSRIRKDVVRGPSGEPACYVVIDGAPLSLVVPFLADGRIVLVRQFRYAWGTSSWECPAGHAEAGETPEVAARRELEEETGYRAPVLERLGELRASAKMSAVFTLFIGRGLTAGVPHPDADEELIVRAFSRAEVEALVAAGEIVHGPSLAGLFLAFGRA
jgi:ADP-ribose pyrophosphatase